MKPLNQMGLRPRARTFRVFVCVLALIATVGTTFASSPINTACPLGFFTNVASRLLSSQMNVNLTHIQIYPTNQYTPAVHRLLQVTANIYDATTTNCYPSVFRPLFWKTNELNGSGILQTDIYVVGYQYVQEPITTNGFSIFTLPTEACDPSVPFGLSGISNNIYGIPWVIGVKKGLPNFNAFELDNTFFIERFLQFNRNTTASSGRIYTTNQMYTIGISNVFGVEDWNSYASNYDNQVIIVARDTLSVGLTNDANFTVVNSIVTNGFQTATPWTGDSFVMPLGTNVYNPQNLAPLGSPPSTNNLYIYFDGSAMGATNVGGITYIAPCFVPVTAAESGSPSTAVPYNYMNAGTPPLPQFSFSTTNRLQAYILDAQNPNGAYILDYVQFGGMNNSFNINQAIADPDNTGLWSTNYYGGGATPYGVIEQYFVSSGGSFPVFDNDEGGAGSLGWSTARVPGAGTDTSPAAQIAFFLAFFSPVNEVPYTGNTAGFVTNIQLSVQAPFTAMRKIVETYAYQANDPLVHYMLSDLNDGADTKTNRVSLATVSTNGLKYIGRVNTRYMPWGTLGNLSRIAFNGVTPDQNAYNLAYKDPQAWSPDYWNFPTNETLNASWLGQVHRGTPWQTIFLKSTNILGLNLTIPNGASANEGLPTWEVWTGDLDPSDAAAMAPVQDWHMASLLASLFNTNNVGALFSANDGNPNDLEGLLNGMTVLTNDLQDLVINFYKNKPQFASLIISSNSIQAATIVSAIESARTASPGQVFVNVGDIFAAPQLSDASPYLNVDPTQAQYGITDAAYEAIPQQLLPLLWEDSVGTVTPANGQTIIQFTGDVNHMYAVQSSPDLMHWTTISTNCPVNGTFIFTNTAAANAQFYRTILLQ